MEDFTPDWSDKFWRHVHPEALSGCWLWHGAATPPGYGSVGRSRGGVVTRHYAHRMAYEMATGVNPGRMDVCHRCDVPACVNPSHLFLGSARDNARDMVLKGRGRNKRFPGELHHGHVLTESEVLAIRARVATGETAPSIHRDYPRVTVACIYDIRSRRSWRHL